MALRVLSNIVVITYQITSFVFVQIITVSFIFKKIWRAPYLTKIPLPPGESNVHLSIVAFIVPSRNKAPFLRTDQSPPLGTMYGSKNVCVECWNMVSLSVKFSTGLSLLPMTRTRDGNCGIEIYDTNDKLIHKLTVIVQHSISKLHIQTTLNDLVPTGN